MFLPLDISCEYWIALFIFGLLCVMSRFAIREFFSRVPGSGTDCPCGVWCRGLTAYVGPCTSVHFFRNLVWNFGFVYIYIYICIYICIYIYIYRYTYIDRSRYRSRSRYRTGSRSRSRSRPRSIERERQREREEGSGEVEIEIDI